MTNKPNIHHRRSIRLKGYDYSQTGLYFITICCHQRNHLFGHVGANNHSPHHSSNPHSPDHSSNDHSRHHPPNPHSPRSSHLSDGANNHPPTMYLNDAGKIAAQCWLAIPDHFPNVRLHEYIIMPNHIHGIIEIMHDGQTLGWSWG